MTPTEVAATLRQFNEWRRGDYEPSEQPAPPDPIEIGEAIDAAIEMIDRLEAAEKERDAAELMSIALRAKIKQMEKQEPVVEVQWAAGIPNGILDFVSTDGYLPKLGDKLYALPGAQPSSSVPDGWLRAIDEALVVAHVGVANESDTYEQAKAKLDNLIGFHVDAATDPAVNGGWKLVPRPPTPTMVKAGLESSHVLNVHRVLACYDAMIDAAPEAKP